MPRPYREPRPDNDPVTVAWIGFFVFLVGMLFAAGFWLAAR